MANTYLDKAIEAVYESPKDSRACFLSSKLHFFSIGVNCMTRHCLQPSMTVRSELARPAASNGLTSALNASRFSSIKARVRKTVSSPSPPSCLFCYASSRKDFPAMTSCSKSMAEGWHLSPSNRNMSALSSRMPFGYRATHKVRPKITDQHAFEVLLSHINNSSWTITL